MVPIKTRILIFISNMLTGNVTYENCRMDTVYPGLITIGKNFISAPGSVVLTHDACLLNKTGKILKKKVVIGDNVYLGYNAIILPGVTLGNNVIVSAGSLVTKSFPDNVLIGGNPARILMTVDQYIKFSELKDK